MPPPQRAGRGNSIAEALRREPRLDLRIKRAFANVKHGTVDGWQMTWEPSAPHRPTVPRILTYHRVTTLSATVSAFVPSSFATSAAAKTGIECGRS